MGLICKRGNQKVVFNQTAQNIALSSVDTSNKDNALEPTTGPGMAGNGEKTIDLDQATKSQKEVLNEIKHGNMSTAGSHSDDEAMYADTGKTPITDDGSLNLP